ncbi:hypothetical protein A4D02_17240 [Niastella koreensis]|uniref:Transcriptional regulator, AraC family n=2 Tax=Niastella koreensis TaxID=354356 RepID=G8TE53_NIAKG|nr:AraC family transcriptional regulator [Niastella koreensis]AEV97244.1 transcriptional regulator, AraC family [Niastella koreensis GR20-10]OQP39080.1 hypothetical protein A4D02_17240 [Niastella koreensis]
MAILRDKTEFYRPNVFLFTGTVPTFAAEEFVREHVLCHVYAGELRYTTAEEDVVVRAGETVLFRRDLLVKCEKRPVRGEAAFSIVYFVFERSFTLTFALKHSVDTSTIDHRYGAVVPIQPTAPLQGVIESLHPYLRSNTFLSPRMVPVKLTEAAFALLEQNAAFGSWLLNGPEEHKPDLTVFMERNFRFNVPVTKFAELSGRSLSTFQRDMRKTFGMNAQAWLLKRRLETAYRLMTTKQVTPVDLYLDLGFENISHFSRAFKKQYGFSPSSLKRKQPAALLPR